MIQKFTISLFLLIGCLSSQNALAQLNMGDIVFVGFRFDGIEGDLGCNDGFAFAALVDIPANTTIFFTEDEYNGSAFEAGEGDLSWVHNAVVPAGTIIEITSHLEGDDEYCGGTNPSPSVNIGTVQFESTGGNWSLATSGEEIYAYLGMLRQPTTWLAALWTDNSDNSNVLPAELVGFLLDFTNVDADADMGILTSGTDCPDRATCLANALNTDNWIIEDDPGADCCDDDGVNYPDDLPVIVGACTQPTITGVEIVECNGPNAFNTVRVNGALNGATEWNWYFGTCEDTDITGIIGEQFTVQFTFPDQTYTIRAQGGCAEENAACFEFIPNELFGPGGFTALDNLCANAGVQSGLGSGTPTGGTYSGPGVTDDGNGMTYSFDPSVAGVGSHEIMYTNECGWSISDVVEVLAAPVVTLSLPDTILVDPNMPPVNFDGTGLPIGGVYSDLLANITDDGNGMTFSFNTLILGANTIFYTYTDPVTGCSNTTSVDIMLVQDPATSTEEANQSLAFEAFPNPTNGLLQFDGISVDDIQLTDALGKLVLQRSNPGLGLDISALPRGIYFLKARKGKRSKTIRIVRQ